MDGVPAEGSVAGRQVTPAFMMGVALERCRWLAIRPSCVIQLDDHLLIKRFSSGDILWHSKPIPRVSLRARSLNEYP